MVYKLNNTQVGLICLISIMSMAILYWLSDAELMILSTFLMGLNVFGIGYLTMKFQELNDKTSRR